MAFVYNWVLGLCTAKGSSHRTLRITPRVPHIMISGWQNSRGRRRRGFLPRSGTCARQPSCSPRRRQRRAAPPPCRAERHRDGVTHARTPAVKGKIWLTSISVDGADFFLKTEAFLCRLFFLSWRMLNRSSTVSRRRRPHLSNCNTATLFVHSQIISTLFFLGLIYLGKAFEQQILTCRQKNNYKARNNE